MGNTPFRWAQPTPQGLTFNDMSFIDNNTGLAVASSGIMRTTDAGRNWKFVTYKYVSSTNTVQLGSFNDVHFVTPSIAYAVGSAGLMIKSTDGGLNWTAITTPLTPMAKNINALHFINKDTGYIGGQALLSTTNTIDINAAPKVYITRNGGLTWDSLATPFRPQQNAVTFSGFNTAEIHRIHFANDSVGYVSGSCGQSIATFSAIVWKIEKNVVKDYSLHRSKFGISATTGSHTPSTSTYRGLLAINDSVVLVSALNNSIAVRVRTGKNDSTASAAPAVFGAYERGVYQIVVWVGGTATPYPAPLAGNIGNSPANHLRKGPDGKVWMILGPNICWSVDHGSNWGFSRIHPAAALYQNWSAQALEVTANGRIIVGSFNGLCYDSLPGSTWQTAYNNLRPGTPIGPYSLGDMDWADNCNGVAVGNAGTILKTSDGGKTWVNNSYPAWDQASLNPGTGIIAVKYPAPDKMFYVGGVTLYRSPDQGTTFTALFAEPSGNAQVFGLEVVGDKAYVIAHRFSGIQRTHIYRVNNINTGPTTVDIYNNFVTGPTGNLAPQLRNIKFANADTGYTCGSRGKVYRTIDGGTTWSDISPDTLVNANGTATYTALSVPNGRTIFIGGSSRKLFRSTDAGVTWTDMTIPLTAVSPLTASPLNSFSSIAHILMHDPNNGYAVSGSTLMKTTDGWNTWTYDISPVGFNTGSGSAMAFYPKGNMPYNSKKLYLIGFQNGVQPNSTNSTHLLEYGDFAITDLATTETITGASCTNPTAGSITIAATGAFTPYQYSINGGAYTTSNVFSGLSGGPKTISIKDASCQVVTKTITIPFTDNLTLSANNDTTVCAGAPVQLNAVATTGATFAWTPTTGLSNPAIRNPIATPSANTTYVVTATLGTCVKTENVVITMKPAPAVNAGPDRTIVVGDQIILNGYGFSNPTSIAWAPSGSVTSGGTTYTPQVKPATTTTYTMTVRNSEGCTSTDDAVVTVLPVCIRDNHAFTPNGDGQNDLWIVTTGTSCVTKVQVTVFNRYGNVVYQNANYNNDWDGKYKGKPVADGTYYYQINYHLINGKVLPRKGDVTILR